MCPCLLDLHLELPQLDTLVNRPLSYLLDAVSTSTCYLCLCETPLSWVTDDRHRLCPSMCPVCMYALHCTSSCGGAFLHASFCMRYVMFVSDRGWSYVLWGFSSCAPCESYLRVRVQALRTLAASGVRRGGAKGQKQGVQAARGVCACVMRRT